MKNKKLIIISIMSTFLISSMMLSTGAAQDTIDADRVPTIDSSDVPDDGLIAPDPDENVIISDDDVILYHTLDENRTAVDDTSTSGAEDANLISTQNSIPNNILQIAAIIVLVIIVLAGAIGIILYHKNKD